MRREFFRDATVKIRLELSGRFRRNAFKNRREPIFAVNCTRDVSRCVRDKGVLFDGDGLEEIMLGVGIFGDRRFAGAPG